MSHPVITTILNHFFGKSLSPRRHSRVGVSKIIGAKRSFGSQQTGRTILQNLRLLSSRNRWKDFDSEGEMRFCALETRCSCYMKIMNDPVEPSVTATYCNRPPCAKASPAVACGSVLLAGDGSDALQECTGYHRHQQVDPWPKSDPKSDRMIFTYFHRKLL